MWSVRRHLRGVVRLFLAVFLFGQFAVAAEACVSMQAAPTMAFAPATAHSCHDESPGNPNACLMHCLQSDQNLDSNQHGPVAQIAATSALLPALFTDAWPPQVQRPVIVAINSSPPISILHCRFLN